MNNGAVTEVVSASGWPVQNIGVISQTGFFALFSGQLMVFQVH